MGETFKTALKTLLALPIGFGAYILYIHVVSVLDGVFTIVLGGAFLLVILATAYWLVDNLKDFIISIFKKDNSVNEKGLKKHF